MSQTGATAHDEIPALRSALEDWAQRERKGATVVSLERLTGGASKETWGLVLRHPAKLERLILRRAAGGQLHAHTLGLADEYRVLQAVEACGVPVPKTYTCFDDLAGKPAFLMSWIDAEGASRRIVNDAALSDARRSLPTQMGAALAAMHALPTASLQNLAGAAHLADFGRAGDVAQNVTTRLAARLDDSGFAAPAIEAGLAWLRAHAAAIDAIDASGGEQGQGVLVHGDFRIGNLLVDQTGLAAVIDWETAHLGSRYEDLAWPMVRAWRFNHPELKLGGIADPRAYLEEYARVSGHVPDPRALAFWEIAGNVRWAISCLIQAQRHLSGAERAVDLLILGRLGAEVEVEFLDLMQRHG